MKCVGQLELLKELGTINIDGVQIKNVRELVAFLKISSYSLYKWQKQLNYLGRNMDELKKEIIDDMSETIVKEKLIPDAIRDEFTMEAFGKQEAKQDIFGIRYFAWFGRTIGIKGYNKMPLAQLKLKIGIKLIKDSGLINNDKVIENLKLEGFL